MLLFSYYFFVNESKVDTQNSKEILIWNKASRVKNYYQIKDKTIIKFDVIWNMVYEM